MGELGGRSIRGEEKGWIRGEGERGTRDEGRGYQGRGEGEVLQ